MILGVLGWTALTKFNNERSSSSPVTWERGGGGGDYIHIYIYIGAMSVDKHGNDRQINYHNCVYALLVVNVWHHFQCQYGAKRGTCGENSNIHDTIHHLFRLLV